MSHLLLAELPDIAISEALESLVDLWRESTLFIPVERSEPHRIGAGRVVTERRAEPVLIAEA